MKDLKVDPEFERMIPPLTAAERLELRASLAAAGRALDPIKVWRGVIVDGHNRFRICFELGLPFKVQRLKFSSRKEALAWMVQHQAARRSLTRDQLLALHVLRGLPTPSGSTATERTHTEAAVAAGYGDQLLSGALSLRQARNRMRPKVPRGPTHGLPEGHELGGLSTLTGPDGETKAEWTKSRVAGAEEPEIDPREQGHHLRGVSQMKRGDGSTVIQWESWDADAAKRERDTLAAWERHAALYAGLAGSVPAPDLVAGAEDLLTVYNLGDPHIGLLAWAPETGANSDLKIACTELFACVDLLVAGVEPSAEAVIANLGDFFHAQGNDQRTPGHGHKLDVDGRHDKVVDAGYALIRRIIDRALEKHRTVHLVNVPGNHDPAEAAGIARWARAVYEREPRVVVHDAYAAIHYMRFGRNLLGWCHGNNAPGRELPALMAADRPEDWGATEHRVFHVGHIHHKTLDKEHPGCMIESHNTMAYRDAYHAARYRARQQLQAIQYHREFGEYSRKTVNLARVKAAMATKDGSK